MAEPLRRTAGVLAVVGGLLLAGVVGTARLLGADAVAGGERLGTLAYLVVHAGLPLAAGLSLLRGRWVLVAGGALAALGALAIVGALDHLGHMILARGVSLEVLLATAGDITVAGAGCAAAVVAHASRAVTWRAWGELRRDGVRIALLVGTALLAVGIPSWPWQPVGPALTQAPATAVWLVAPPGWTRVVVLATIVAICAVALVAARVRPSAPAVAIAVVIAAVGSREIIEAIALRRVWEDGMTVEPIVWAAVHVVGLALVVGAAVRIGRRSTTSSRSDPSSGQLAR